MSDSDDGVTVDADGVSIRKTLNDHQFETLAVVFDIRSGRESAAAVRIADAIPDGVVVDDIGFHPEYGAEHWQAGEDEVLFGRSFEPGEQYTTVYGVRDFDGEGDDLLSEPTVDVDTAAVGGGVESINDLVSEEDSDIVREVISGERDTLPSLEDEEAPAAGDAADATGTADEAEEPTVVDGSSEEADVAVEAGAGAVGGVDEVGGDEDEAAADADDDGAEEPAIVEPDDGLEDVLVDGAVDVWELGGEQVD